MARRRRTGDWAEDEPRWERPEFRLPRFALKKFIVRLVWLTLLLLALAVTVVFLLVGGALQVMGGAVGVQGSLGMYRVAEVVGADDETQRVSFASSPPAQRNGRIGGRVPHYSAPKGDAPKADQ